MEILEPRRDRARRGRLLLNYQAKRRHLRVVPTTVSRDRVA